MRVTVVMVRAPPAAGDQWRGSDSGGGDGGSGGREGCGNGSGARVVATEVGGERGGDAGAAAAAAEGRDRRSRWRRRPGEAHDARGYQYVHADSMRA